MQQTGVINFRPGKLEDLPDVTELCKDVWNGHDYMPFVWEKRISDPGNLIFVLELDGVMAGFYGLVILEGTETKTSWWQGVRVATPYKNRGLASLMLEHAFKASKEYGVTKVRFATGEYNPAMHRVADKYGFSFVAPFTYITVPAAIDITSLAGNESASLIRRLDPEDFELVWGFIETKAASRPGGNLYCDAWVWKDFEPVVLRNSLLEQRVFGYFEATKLVSLALGKWETMDGKNYFFIWWMDGPPEALTGLAKYLQQYATREAGQDQDYVMETHLPRDETREGLLREVGFRLEPSDYMRVYELNIG